MIQLEDLSEPLQAAIKSFAAKAEAEGFHTSEGAYNECQNASDMFLHELSDHGLEDGEIEHYSFCGWRFPEDDIEYDIFRYPYEVCEETVSHWAVRIEGVIVDWTARQFDVTAPFPAIWREVNTDASV